MTGTQIPTATKTESEIVSSRYGCKSDVSLQKNPLWKGTPMIQRIKIGAATVKTKKNISQ